MPRQRKLPAGLWKRGDTYYARFRAGGRLVRSRLSSDLDTAKTLLNDLKARADRNDFGLLDNDCPWETLKGEFLRWVRQSCRRPRDYIGDIKRVESFLKVTNVRQISDSMIIAYREWRTSQNVTNGRRKPDAVPIARKVSPRTVNREVATLNSMLNHGVAWKLIGENPLGKLKPLRHEKPIKERRPLTVEELQRLFEVSPPRLANVWRMFACTGMRLMEIADLRFSDIDFVHRTVTVRANVAKSGKSREIPLDDTMLAILQELKAKAAARKPVATRTVRGTEMQARLFTRDHVFVSTANTPHGSSLLKRFYGCCRLAGIDDAGACGAVDLHSLRVSFATLAIENGASPKAVQSILGHSTLEMTMRVYSKATDRGARHAINALPFASASAPDHLIPVQNAHTARTSRKTSTQPKAGLALA